MHDMRHARKVQNCHGLFWFGKYPGSGQGVNGAGSEHDDPWSFLED
jgi:hypothetical protein